MVDLVQQPVALLLDLLPLDGYIVGLLSNLGQSSHLEYWQSDHHPEHGLQGVQYVLVGRDELH